jgi:hypothetical protein
VTVLSKNHRLTPWAQRALFYVEIVVRCCKGIYYFSEHQKKMRELHSPLIPIPKYGFEK